MPIVKISLHGEINEFTANTGEGLLPFLREKGYSLPPAPCGGKGRCGKCLVVMEQAGNTTREPACLISIGGDMTVFLEEEAATIISAGKGLLFQPDHDAEGIGAAVDIGTTTVVLYLVDLKTGKILNTKSGQNRQRSFGADVISRIQYCNEHPDGLLQLTGEIRRQIKEYLLAACNDTGHRADELGKITIAGNTIMEHIFTGLSPSSIALAPFTPLSLFGEDMDAVQLDLDSSLPVYIAPCVAGYVGGDITAGLLASGVHKREDSCFFLDIGTNGEMALGKDGRFLCCATAAGPAFEGAEISCGMSGVTGAISRVWAENETILFEVIGDVDPKGICGSGLVDVLAVLLELGLVDESGRLLPKSEVPEAYWPQIQESGNRVRLYLSDTVFISDEDIRKLQLAKAAVAAGIRTLLTESGLDAEDIDTVHLAGGFGNYLNKVSAARIGMIPDAFVNKIISEGNSAGMGAVEALISQNAKKELEALWQCCEYFELSGSAVFNDAFIDCLVFE